MVKPQKNIIFLALCTIVLLIMEIVYTSVPPIVYGSVIALVLATVCLSSGLSSAILLCILSPVMSMLFSNIDRWVLVPAIIVANILYVCIIYIIKNLLKKHINYIWTCLIAVATASLIRYTAMSYINVDAMAHFYEIETDDLNYLSKTFGIIQLYTSLAGGCIAVFISLGVKKLIRK